VPGGIVIGAGPGIGTAVARRLAREGLPVGVIARSQTTVDRALAALNGAPKLGRIADATDDAGLRAALDAFVAAHGVPDVLVYNAALIQSDPFGSLDPRAHLDAYAVNVVGAITAIAHVAPRMAERGTGTIIVTGGMRDAVPGATSLSITKAALRALTELLATEYGPAGVHVATVTVAGAVAPGTAYDPDDIAERYWALHTQPREGWDHEVVHG
jgi:NAD(P)-dependent dehydrogenase (short-subunit alcohol dehydrogenase family)